jgi:hypothetical protein
MGTITNYVTGSNLVISIILGGSMQRLFGMIRTMQILAMSSLIFVTFPSHTMTFFGGAIMFANIDIFSGDELYEAIFEFKTTYALNDKFDQYGMSNKNFIMNSGSYFIMQILIIVNFFMKRLIKYICKKFARIRVFRVVGIYINDASIESYDQIKKASLKLFLESYFDLVFAIFLGLSDFLDVKSKQELGLFFGTSDDFFCSLLTLAMLSGIFVFPFWSYK